MNQERLTILKTFTSPTLRRDTNSRSSQDTERKGKASACREFLSISCSTDRGCCCVFSRVYVVHSCDGPRRGTVHRLWQAERNQLPKFSRWYPLRCLFSEGTLYEEFDNPRHKSPHTCNNKAEVKKLFVLTNLYKARWAAGFRALWPAFDNYANFSVSRSAFDHRNCLI